MTQTMEKPGPLMAIPKQEQGQVPTGGMADLTPKTLDEAMRFADILSGSSIIPKDYQGKPGNVLVAIQWGYELGLPPMQAMQNIAVINGRPSIWGDAMLALVQASGKLEYINEDVGDDGASCTVKRKGQANSVTREFTRDDAQQASLLNKQGPWTQYPKRMMQMRARGFALRDTFADVLRGVAMAEEARDMPDDMRDVTPEEEAPKGGSKASSVASKVAKKRGRDSGAKDDGAPSLSIMIKNMDAAKTEAALTDAAKDAGKLAGGDIEKARKHYRKRLDEIRAAAGHEKPAPDIDLNKAADLIEKDLAATMGDGVDEVLDVYKDQMAALEGAMPDVHQRLLDLAENIRGIGGEDDGGGDA
ncbi:recombinase RecT [Roseovarius nitratireducens]|uniref:recombinase RecT n=1 Tax=Roseovarius nitratireducens TaxID=2044597 RepID=UPI000CE1768F|nr:recombinase RecT [Roseovarius nitratireducens]